MNKTVYKDKDSMYSSTVETEYEWFIRGN